MNSIFTAQTSGQFSFYDDVDDISGTGEFNDSWNFSGSPSSVHWTKPPVELPFYDYLPGDTNPACDALASGQLESYGCSRAQDSCSHTQGRAGSEMRSKDDSTDQITWIGDLIGHQNIQIPRTPGLEARAEFFDILNHPNFAGVDGDLVDGYQPGGTTGQAQYTTDIAASNPVVGSGGARHIQFGLKFIW